MKKSYSNFYIFLLCAHSVVSLHAAQNNTPANKKPKNQKNIEQHQKQLPTNNISPQNNAVQNNHPAQQKENPSLNISTPATQKPQTNTPSLQKISSIEQKSNSNEKKSHSIIIHATRMLPKKTMVSLDQLIQGLPNYKKTINSQSAVNQQDIEKLQTSLSSFAQALGEKHPYLTHEKHPAAVTLDESAINNHIQIILKSLPWYIQNPKTLSSKMDLHEFAKQLNIMHNQIKIEAHKKNQAIASEKQKKNSSPDRVQTTSLRPEKFSEDQTDILEDSDGTPFPASLETHENNDVITQSLSKKSNQLFHVINKRGKILGSYQRNKTKNGFHIGKFTTIRGKKRCVIEGTMQAPKLHGVHKKAIGIVRNSSYSQEDITLYNYNPAPTKKHSA